MLTCLCDAFYGEVGIATVQVLEACGIAVEFPEDQTCCGQPPFNSGDWNSARPVAERCAKLFRSSDLPVVVPSGSCTAMLSEGYDMLLGAPVPAFELSEFLVDVIGAPTLLKFENVSAQRIAFHSSCHGRAIGLSGQAIQLLNLVPNLEICIPEQPEQCCGFGGAFSITHSRVSSEIGNEKLRQLHATGAETIVSGDMGCLMQLNGLIQKQGLPLKTMHWVEIVAGALA